MWFKNYNSQPLQMWNYNFEFYQHIQIITLILSMHLYIIINYNLFLNKTYNQLIYSN